ncbi:MAG: PIN domain-containing protein [Candidatus Berkelbacteria bacterium]|nr:PIN domain-containing protein [Candidatus Berkelbacteria bacterium]MCR4307059.1 PIN domain-containing protein [Candidatus Berkelbacteria bacterium]
MDRMAGSLDANVLLRLLLNDVPEQHQAALKLYNHSRGQFAIADTAIIEIIFVLSGANYRFSRIEVVEAIEGLMELEKVSCNHALFEKALPLFANHPKLSFEDCCLATYAQLENAEPLWTFDKKLASQVSGTKLVP